MRLPFSVRTRDYAILSMEIADCAEIAAVHEEDFKRPWSETEFAELISQDNVFGFVAREVGTRRPGGFVLARLTAGEAEILTIAVRRVDRRAGLGRDLMEAVLRYLHAARAETLFLEVDETNQPAIALYRRCGFAEIARRKGYYGDAKTGRTDALVMRRDFPRRIVK